MVASDLSEIVGIYRNGVVEFETKVEEFKDGDYAFFKVYWYMDDDFENCGGYIP